MVFPAVLVIGIALDVIFDGSDFDGYGPENKSRQYRKRRE